MTKTSDALEILNAKTGRDPEIKDMVHAAGLRAEIGMLAYGLREKLHLSQDELGRKIGHDAEWIDDLEMGDFQGDALAALRTVADEVCIKIDAEIERLRNEFGEEVPCVGVN